MKLDQEMERLKQRRCITSIWYETATPANQPFLKRLITSLVGYKIEKRIDKNTNHEYDVIVYGKENATDMIIWADNHHLTGDDIVEMWHYLNDDTDLFLEAWEHASIFVDAVHHNPKICRSLAIDAMLTYKPPLTNEQLFREIQEMLNV